MKSGNKFIPIVIGCDACPAPNELLVNIVMLNFDEAMQDDDGSKIEVHLLPWQDDTSIVFEAHLYPETVST